MIREKIFITALLAAWFCAVPPARAAEKHSDAEVLLFQQRIRLALANHAEVRAVTFLHRGRQRSGNEVRIAPYRDNPLKSRFQKYATKYYVFTLSDSLPGSLYQIRAVVPGTDGGKTSLMEESLTFDRADEPTGKQ